MNRGTHASGDGSFGRDAGTQTLKAVVLVVVAVVIGWALLRHTGTTKVATTTPTTHPARTSTSTTTTSVATTTTTVALIPPSTVKLQVLNGVLVGELSTYFSDKLRASPGYDTLSPRNATAKVSASVIYVITPNYVPEADALATTLKLPATAVQAAVPATAPIPAASKAAANLVLIIGPDLAAQAK